MKFLNNLIRKVEQVPFFFKIWGIAFFLILLFCIGVLVETKILFYKAFKNQFEEKNIAISKGLAGKLTEPVIIGDLSGIFALLKETGKTHKDIRYVLVLDGNYKVLAHTFGHNVSDELKEANKIILRNHLDFHLETFDTEEGEILDILAPVMEGRLGVVRLGFMTTPLKQTLQSVIEVVIISSIIMAFIGIGISYLLIHILNKPLKKLIAATDEVSKGNISARVNIKTNDELGRLGNKFNSMAEILEKNHFELKQKDEMRQELIKKIIFAQEEERNRIARELHDQTGQTLTSLKLSLKSFEAEKFSDKMKNNLENFRTLLNNSLENIHDFAVELRPPLLDDFGLCKAIPEYSKEFGKASGIEINCNLSGFTDDCKLPSPVGIGIYRVIQEAFSNIQKHSKATLVNINFQKINSMLSLTIEDNGIGFDVASQFAPLSFGEGLGLPAGQAGVRHSQKRKPLGIFGMKERIEIFGGTFNIESKIKQGTKIHIEIPIQ